MSWLSTPCLRVGVKGPRVGARHCVRDRDRIGEVNRCRAGYRNPIHHTVAEICIVPIPYPHNTTSQWRTVYTQQPSCAPKCLEIHASHKSIDTHTLAKTATPRARPTLYVLLPHIWLFITTWHLSPTGSKRMGGLVFWGRHRGQSRVCYMLQDRVSFHPL